MIGMMRYASLYPTSELRVAYTSGHTSRADSSCLVMFAVSASTPSVMATNAGSNSSMSTHVHRRTPHPRASTHDGRSGGLQQRCTNRRRVVTAFAARRNWLVWWHDAWDKSPTSSKEENAGAEGDTLTKRSKTDDDTTKPAVDNLEVGKETTSMLEACAILCTEDERAAGGGSEDEPFDMCHAFCSEADFFEDQSEESFQERRLVDSSDTISDPYGFISDVSTPLTSLQMVNPEALMPEALPALKKYTGIPVIDAEGQCVGVLSDRDVRRWKKEKRGPLDNVLVSELMSSPPIVIKEHARIAFAAGLMLKNKVHRLPVVDDSNKVVGIVSRTDVFEAVMPDMITDPLLRRHASDPGHPFQSH